MGFQADLHPCLLPPDILIDAFIHLCKYRDEMTMYEMETRTVANVKSVINQHVYYSTTDKK